MYILKISYNTTLCEILNTRKERGLINIIGHSFYKNIKTIPESESTMFTGTVNGLHFTINDMLKLQQRPVFYFWLLRSYSMDNEADNLFKSTSRLAETEAIEYIKNNLKIKDI